MLSARTESEVVRMYIANLMITAALIYCQQSTRSVACSVQNQHILSYYIARSPARKIPSAPKAVMPEEYGDLICGCDTDFSLTSFDIGVVTPAVEIENKYASERARVESARRL